MSILDLPRGTGEEGAAVVLSLAHLLPLHNENRWSDLLAVLIEADPDSASRPLALGNQLGQVTVRREAPAGLRDRLDLLITVGGRAQAIVEVKVLSGLGVGQLLRYGDAFEGVQHRVLVFSERLPVDLTGVTGWRPVTWERLLAAFQTSPDAWVSQTAEAWLTHLNGALPCVDARTRWNDLQPGEDFVIAMRTRMSWVFSQLHPPPPIDHDLVESAAGASWVARMNLPTSTSGYWIRVEAEENLPVRNFPSKAPATGNPIRGPSVKVCLVQRNVATSAGFDWTYLAGLWPLMAAARRDWATQPARPKAKHDRDGWQAMIARGGPRHLGIGFGDAQARRSHECMFGARFQLPPNVRLRTVVDALHDTANLMITMAAATHPTT
jgi:hypothetical protein